MSIVENLHLKRAVPQDKEWVLSGGKYNQALEILEQSRLIDNLRALEEIKPKLVPGLEITYVPTTENVWGRETMSGIVVHLEWGKVINEGGSVFVKKTNIEIGSDGTLRFGTGAMGEFGKLIPRTVTRKDWKDNPSKIEMALLKTINHAETWILKDSPYKDYAAIPPFKKAIS